MAAIRFRRSKSGNKIAKLINEAVEDAFYKNSYEGFHDNDDDYKYMEKDEEKDVINSDFSINETDNPISDQEGEAFKSGQKRKYTAGFQTKAYKETKPVYKREVNTSNVASTSSQENLQPKRSEKCFTIFDTDCKSIRTSTAIKAQATEMRLKELTEARKHKKRVIKTEHYIPTQAEMLEEAKITEAENLKSLEKYQNMELEKKICRRTQRRIVGPIIRYHSMTMPGPSQTSPCSGTGNSSSDKYERTFITFENDFCDEVFNSSFKPKRVQRNLTGYTCPITKMPANYLDPVTNQPYYNIPALKILREAYYMQLEERGNKDHPDMAKWLAWRKKVKEDRIRSQKKDQSSVSGGISTTATTTTTTRNETTTK